MRGTTQNLQEDLIALNCASLSELSITLLALRTCADCTDYMASSLVETTYVPGNWPAALVMLARGRINPDTSPGMHGDD